MTACGSSTDRSAPTPTPTWTPTPTPIQALPTLTAENGWHVVLTLGNVCGNPVNTGGSFVATKPYRLSYTCEGSGTLQVAYPLATETAPCGATPEPNGTRVFPPTANGGLVTINVTAEGTVQWELIAEMQD